MDKHSTFVRLLAAAALAFLCSSTASADPPQDDGGAWLDGYLAAELGYDQEEIDAFKATVAPLSRDEMKDLVRRLKFARARSGQEQQQRLTANRHNFQRLQAAEATARARPSRVAPQHLDAASRRVAPRQRIYPVHRTGLFRGYYGWIRIP